MSEQLDPTRRTPRKRVRRALSGITENRLAAYALAAGAGLAVSAAPATATNLITDNIPIPVDNTNPTLLDINSDGLFDFAFWHTSSTWYSTASSYGQYASLWVQGYQSGASVVGSGSMGSRLYPSDHVTSNNSFLSSAFLAAAYTSYWWGGPFSGSYGPFANQYDAFLGVQFPDSGGEIHSGFVRLDVPASPPYLYPVITGYGYEPNAGTAAHIPIPEPASLSLLALGALGLVAWRRKKQKKA